MIIRKNLEFNIQNYNEVPLVFSTIKFIINHDKNLIEKLNFTIGIFKFQATHE